MRTLHSNYLLPNSGSFPCCSVKCLVRCIPYLPCLQALHMVVGTALDKETLAQWRGIEYMYKEEGGQDRPTLTLPDSNTPSF